MKSAKQTTLSKEILKMFPINTKPEIFKKGIFTIIKPNFTQATAGMIKGAKISVKEILEDYEDSLIERGLNK